jgi:hypothetical protein
MEDDRRKDVEDAYDEHDEPEMNYCPSCGKKIPATNTGGASVGGGSAAAASSGGG